MPRSNRISVLIVDDIADTRDNLQKLLQFERDIEVVGSASSGSQAIDLAKQVTPDIVIMDINMPGMDGIATAEAIRAQGLPSQVIMMSVHEEQDCLRRSMLAGAREFLVKPFSGEELALTIRRVYERAERTVAPAGQPAAAAAPAEVASSGRVISIFSPKGGVGRTTIACNLAVALKQQTGRSVVLIDCSLPFGDVGVFLNLQPSKTIVDLLPHVAGLDADLLDEFFTRHSSGVDILAAPTRPEMAELVSSDSLKRILARVREGSDYVIVDIAPSFAETNLAVLDLSDQIVVPLTLDLSAVKNVRLFLDVAQALGYPREKLLLVLNRSTGVAGVSPKDVEERLGQLIGLRIPSDEHLATLALNQGTPFVLQQRNSPIAKSLLELAQLVANPAEKAAAPAQLAEDEAESKRRSFIRLPWRAKAPVQAPSGAR